MNADEDEVVVTITSTRYASEGENNLEFVFEKATFVGAEVPCVDQYQYEINNPIEKPYDYATDHLIQNSPHPISVENRVEISLIVVVIAVVIFGAKYFVRSRTNIIPTSSFDCIENKIRLLSHNSHLWRKIDLNDIELTHEFLQMAAIDYDNKEYMARLTRLLKDISDTLSKFELSAFGNCASVECSQFRLSYFSSTILRLEELVMAISSRIDTNQLPTIVDMRRLHEECLELALGSNDRLFIVEELSWCSELQASQELINRADIQLKKILDDEGAADRQMTMSMVDDANNHLMHEQRQILTMGQAQELPMLMPAHNEILLLDDDQSSPNGCSTVTILQDWEESVQLHASESPQSVSSSSSTSNSVTEHTKLMYSQISIEVHRTSREAINGLIDRNNKRADQLYRDKQVHRLSARAQIAASKQAHCQRESDIQVRTESLRNQHVQKLQSVQDRCTALAKQYSRQLTQLRRIEYIKWSCVLGASIILYWILHIKNCNNKGLIYGWWIDRSSALCEWVAVTDAAATAAERNNWSVHSLLNPVALLSAPLSWLGASTRAWAGAGGCAGSLCLRAAVPVLVMLVTSRIGGGMGAKGAVAMFIWSMQQPLSMFLGEYAELASIVTIQCIVYAFMYWQTNLEWVWSRDVAHDAPELCVHYRQLFWWCYVAITLLVTTAVALAAHSDSWIIASTIDTACSHAELTHRALAVFLAFPTVIGQAVGIVSSQWMLAWHCIT